MADVNENPEVETIVTQPAVEVTPPPAEEAHVPTAKQEPDYKALYAEAQAELAEAKRQQTETAKLNMKQGEPVSVQLTMDAFDAYCYEHYDGRKLDKEEVNA